MIANHKTKIVATIGPASESPEMLQRLIRAGLNVARLNFSHGDFSQHGKLVGRIRDAGRVCGRRVAIMADLPGPKMRLGRIAPEPIHLVPGDRFTLTTSAEMTGPDRMTSIVEHALETVPCEAILAPTLTGNTARSISSCKPSVWIVAPGSDPAVCQALAFSYGVHPVDLADEPADWCQYAARVLPKLGLPASRLLLVAGPSPQHPDASHRLELMRLSTP